MRPLGDLRKRHHELQELKKKHPENDLLYAIQQVALEEVAWAVYGETLI